MQKLKTLLRLFLTMFKIGLFTFGGGYAMLVLLENEFVQKRKWMETDEFTDVVAIAESTPGPIAINASTYVGYKTAKTIGAIVSTVAVCLPSLIIIFLISLFFEAFLAFKYVAYAFEGIRVCVCLLILFAGVKMLKKLKRNVFNGVLFFISFAAVILLGLFDVDFSTVYFVLAGGVVGVIFYLVAAAVAKSKRLKTEADVPADFDENAKQSESTPDGRVTDERRDEE